MPRRPRIYPILQHTWITPKGNLAHFAYREGTSDWNTITSIMVQNDEYGLAALDLTGLALDVGAHLGAATIALLLDNPSLSVIAVEAVPPNVEMIRRNLALNGLEDRCRVVGLAASAPGIDHTEVWFGSRGDENAEHHAFIGNSKLVYDSPGTKDYQTAVVACISLGALLGRREASFIKIDCEGCEWGFLSDPTVSQVARIHGEWHPTGNHRRPDIVALLSQTHDVTTSAPAGVDPEVGPGGFVAVRR